MAKLPILLHKELNIIQIESIPTIAGWVARIKGNCPNLPSWISEKGAEYYEGLLEGNHTMIERSLSIYNCYRGYQEQEDIVEIGGKKYTLQYNKYYF